MKSPNAIIQIARSWNTFLVMRMGPLSIHPPAPGDRPILLGIPVATPDSIPKISLDPIFPADLPGRLP